MSQKATQLVGKSAASKGNAKKKAGAQTSTRGRPSRLKYAAKQPWRDRKIRNLMRVNNLTRAEAIVALDTGRCPSRTREPRLTVRQRLELQQGVTPVGEGHAWHARLEHEAAALDSLVPESECAPVDGQGE